MFEKEAEELFNKKPLGYAMNPELEIYTDGFKDGYNKAKEEMQKNGLALQSDMDKTIEQNIQLKKELNKANEWHYVKDEEYPTDEKDVEVLYQDCDKINVYNCIYDIQAENWLYYNLDNMLLELFPFNVIAWKEIVLPEEIKENDFS